ncbi:MAG: aminotransferase class III-fold pyridoxal phosphate-dependent enzyme, partial [Gammaproteobacteria bacterium]|nr:aminotransferase class III-fold pyridoxal phosphate-dependent enzyme [Gammaproteobacteria bacterium]
MATTEIRSASKIDSLFEEMRPKSLQMNERAKRVLPDGIEHDQRIHKPFPIYIDHANGAHKWDLDGNRYVDLVVGHGALLLGHNHPVVMGKVAEQLKRGTHVGASHENMVQWAEWVCKLVPSAEMVRFFSSGTEATMMAMRLARNITGKN